jgi:phosphatidylserine decarboxylase
VLEARRNPFFPALSPNAVNKAKYCKHFSFWSRVCAGSDEKISSSEVSSPLSGIPAPSKTPARHQYIDRASGSIRDERLYWDSLVSFIYSDVREAAPNLFRVLTGARTSHYLGLLNYDLALGTRLLGPIDFARKLGAPLSECLEDPATLDTARKFFERKIKYWECRPMPDGPGTVVSPADARVLVGSLCETSALFIKEKFFSDEELLGPERTQWVQAFKGGDFAVFRLTPEKYHYNHTPVAGCLVDFYQVDGDFHSCNPGPVVAIATPYSKNKRVVSIVDTDVPGGTWVGLVAIIEVVALMIGEIVQVYSEARYDSPTIPRVGQFLFKGVPKSLYRPGSSTDVLLFQRGRIRFDDDLVINRSHPRAQSRFSKGFGISLVETEVLVRSSIANAATRSAHDS